MSKKDYYEVLGVSKSAGIDEIKANYRKLAMKYHPDRNPDDNEAEDNFKLASEAYEVLSDQDKRSRYDRYGHDGLRMGQDYHGFSNFDDIFSAFGDIFSGSGIFDEFFGGSRGRRQSSRRSMGERGSDLKIQLPMTLEEIATGVEKNLKVKRWMPCETCSGSGAKKGSAGYNTCNTCGGSGQLRQVQRSVFGQIVNIVSCSTCNGTGKIIKEPCEVCHGDGRTQGEDTIKVTIPAGVEGGNYLPVRDKGNAGRHGGETGDLIVIITEKEHPYFIRQNNDVIYHLTISFPSAVLGDEVEVPTLFGPEKIKIAAGTQPGTVIRLKEKGIPNLNSHGKGNQLVYVNVYVPTNLGTKDKAIVKELAGSEGINPKKKHQSKDKDFFEKVKDVFF